MGKISATVFQGKPCLVLGTNKGKAAAFSFLFVTTPPLYSLPLPPFYSEENTNDECQHAIRLSMF